VYLSSRFWERLYALLIQLLNCGPYNYITIQLQHLTHATRKIFEKAIWLWASWFMPIPSHWSNVLKLCYPSGLRYLKTEKALQKTPLSERLLKLLLWSHFKLHWCCAQSSHRLWVEHKTLGIIALSADVSQFPSSTMIFGNWSQIKHRYSKFKLMLEGTKASNSKSYTLLPLRLPIHIPELGIHISLRRYLLRKRQRSTNTARCTNATD
jgi:hypothetical protein